MKENIIHPTAIIGKDVELGYGNVILPFTIIDGKVRIGNGNRIGPHVVIGCPATDTKHVDFGYDDPCVIIGNDNEIREFSLIEQPCYEEHTIIGNEVFIMQGVHISHDVHICDKAVLTNTSVLAGIVKVLEGANVAMACTINQYTTIGQYSIVATNSACMKNVRPFSRYIPGKPISVNKYAIEKYGFGKFQNEIEDYVLRNIMPESPEIRRLIDEFDMWVAKYGHQTY